MKILKIKDNKGLFINPKDWKTDSPDDLQPYKSISTINKDDLICIIDYLIANSVEFDEPEEDGIPNPVERIIYDNVLEGIKKAQLEKKTVLAAIDEKFEEAEKKYC